MKTEAQKEQNRIATRNWYQRNKERALKSSKEWRENNKEHKSQTNKEWIEQNREHYNKKHRDKWKNFRLEGITQYCTHDYDKIENFELAKLDNFNPDIWVLHHREENLYKRSTLIDNHQYYYLPHDKLIWLRKDEHDSDRSIAIKHPELSKWHKRMLE